MNVAFRIFRDNWITWEELFSQAAEFASQLGPERLINISHSVNNQDGVVTVWYWA